MPITLDDFILSNRDYYGTYHHHKEQMAYTATALYLAASTAVIIKGHEVWKWGPRWLIVGLLLSSGLAGFWFVVWQLRMRAIAAELVAACNSISAKLLATQLPQPDLTPTPFRGHQLLPHVLVCEYCAVAISHKGLQGARKSEFITYFAMAVYSVAVFVSIY